MQRNGLAWILLALTVGVSGCGSSQGPGEAAPGPTAVQPTARDATATPEGAVSAFLEAVRTGDDEKVSQLLTSRARDKTSELDMVVAPPGSDTASFKVAEVEYIGDDGAHVASFWTDVDDEGNEHTDTIIWMVRNEPEGWRIAGMATRIYDDVPPTVLNFEEPEEMLAEKQAAEAEIARRENRDNGQPKSGATGEKKDPQ